MMCICFEMRQATLASKLLALIILHDQTTVSEMMGSKICSILLRLATFSVVQTWLPSEGVRQKGTSFKLYQRNDTSLFT